MSKIRASMVEKGHNSFCRQFAEFSEWPVDQDCPRIAMLEMLFVDPLKAAFPLLSKRAQWLVAMLMTP
jgi:hypothetical protein